MDGLAVEYHQCLNNVVSGTTDVENRLQKLYDALETGKIQLADLSPRIHQLRQRQEELQSRKLVLEQELSARRLELADTETVTRCVSDLRNELNESSLAERKSFIRSFVKEVEVTRDEVLLTYTIPLLPNRISEERLPVLCIGHDGGR
jgi:ATP-dependent Lon protease